MDDNDGCVDTCTRIDPNVGLMVCKALRLIAENPAEQKFRCLKLTNKAVQRLWNDSNSKHLLNFAGFIVDGNVWELPLDASLSRLRNLCHILEARFSEDSNSPAQMTPTSLVNEIFDEQGQSRLHAAAALGDYEGCIHILQTAPSLLLHQDSNGWLPIHEAIRGRNIPIVMLLLMENGARQLASPTTNGASALWWAKHLKCTEIVPILLEYGAVEMGPNPEDEISNCMACNRQVVHVECHTSTLFRAPRSSAACYCQTCKATSTTEFAPFVICGECFNTGAHSHPSDHVFGLVGSETSTWRSGRGMPPPPPPSSNRRGPWG